MNNEIRNLFDYLNDNCSYIVLRNWENLFEKDIYTDGHEDIDILCEDREEFVSLIKAHRIHPENTRDNYIIQWNNIKVRVDVRWVGDGYYPSEMERVMLINRVRNQQGIFIPSRNDFYYSLLYHALVQKPFLSEEYMVRLMSIRQDKYDANREQIEPKLLEELRNYLIVNSLSIEYPNDPGVYLNKRVMKRMPVMNNHLRIINRFCFHSKRFFIDFSRRLFK